MKCPRCQAQNDDQARFCEDCGAPLELACPRCGQLATAGKKFCRSCGAPLPPASADRFPSPEAYTPSIVAVKPLGPVPLKGLAKPVEVYEATGAGPAQTRFQATVRRGLTRFVGRDAELENLRRAQHLAATGHGQVAAIVGEAGVGKSRLVHEFTHSCRLDGWLVLESYSVAYGKGISYSPLIDPLKSYLRSRTGTISARSVRR